MTAQLISETTKETVQKGFLQLGVTQVYQVILPDRDNGADDALSAAGVPNIGSSSTFGAATLYLIDRTASRVDADATGKKWNVTCQYSNNTEQFARDTNGQPVTNPTSEAKRVDIQYLEYSEPVTDATFLEVTEGGGHSVGTALTAPSWMDDGNVTVSTGETVHAERTAYRQNITVTRLESSWTSSYDSYVNTINNASLTITETDSTGTKATYTFDAKTLRMKPITKQPVWIDSNLYFRVSFPMEHKVDTWIHAEADVSQSERIYAGQDKPGGGTWTQSEIDDLYPDTTAGTVKFAWLTMTEKTPNGKEVAIGDPRPLNGSGARLGVDATGNVQGKSCYTNWKIFEEKDWSPLSL